MLALNTLANVFRVELALMVEVPRVKEGRQAFSTFDLTASLNIKCPISVNDKARLNSFATLLLSDARVIVFLEIATSVHA